MSLLLYLRVLAKFPFPTIVYYSALGIGLYLFYRRKVIAKFYKKQQQQQQQNSNNGNNNNNDNINNNNNVYEKMTIYSSGELRP